MNRNILIVLGGGFLIAVLVALMVQMSLGGSKKTQQVAAPEARSAVIVATRALKTGDTLGETNMKWMDLPQSAVFPGMVVRSGRDQTVQAALSGRLLRDVGEGEPILSSAVVKDKGNFLAATLREGMRAVSLDLRPAGMVAGFATPGDYVDVLLTYRGRMRYTGDNPNIHHMFESNFDRLATETIMENVRVLAVDQRMRSEEPSSGGKNAANRVGKTVTLEVSPEGAEVLWLARKMGDVSLSLRRLGDDDVREGHSPATTDSRITSIWHEIYATMEKMGDVSSGQGNNIVRIYTGANINDVRVGQ